MIQTAIGIVVGAAISFFIAMVFWERRRISYWTESRSLFAKSSLNAVNGFDIKFRGGEVSSVSQHTIYLWNSGNRALWKPNFEVENELRFQFQEDSEIILDEILAISDGVELNPTVEGDVLLPKITSLDSGKGVVLSILEARDDGLEPEKHEPMRPKPSGHVTDLTSGYIRQHIPDRDLEAGCFKAFLGFLFLVVFVVVALQLFGAISWPPDQSWLYPGMLLLSVIFAFSFNSAPNLIAVKSQKIPEEFFGLRGKKVFRRDSLSEAVDEVANSFKEN